MSKTNNIGQIARRADRLSDSPTLSTAQSVASYQWTSCTEKVNSFQPNEIDVKNINSAFSYILFI